MSLPVLYGLLWEAGKNPDPRWLCLELDACPATTCSGSNCAAVTDVQVGFKTAAQGGSFAFSFNVTFGAGVGTVGTAVQLHSGDTTWMAGKQPLVVSPASNQPQSFKTTTELKNGGSSLATGYYNTTVLVCTGDCGSAHKSTGAVIGSAPGPVVEVVAAAV
jgi:hypothetical protein